MIFQSYHLILFPSFFNHFIYWKSLSEIFQTSYLFDSYTIFYLCFIPRVPANGELLPFMSQDSSFDAINAF